MIRERKEELSATVPFAVGTEQIYPNGIPRDLPLTRLLVTVEGRFRITAQTTAGTILPEAPQSLIRNLRLKGTKVSGGGGITLVDLTGEELSMLTTFYEQYDALGSRKKETNVPGTVFPAPGAASAVGEFDFRFSVIVPIAPRFATHEDEIAGILDPAIFSQLDLVIKWGDTTQIITGGTGITASLTAYGSTVGVPSVSVHRFSPLAANLPIMQYHYTHLSKQVNMAALAAAANDALIQNQLNIGNKVRTIMFRQYNEAAGFPRMMLTARVGDGVGVGIFRWRIKINGAEKFRVKNRDLREMNGQQSGFRGTLDEGYAIVDWADRGFLEDVFDTRGFGATATRFELFGDWLGETATDRLDITVIEQVPVEA